MEKNLNQMSLNTVLRRYNYRIGQTFKTIPVFNQCWNKAGNISSRISKEVGTEWCWWSISSERYSVLCTLLLECNSHQYSVSWQLFNQLFKTELCPADTQICQPLHTDVHIYTVCKCWQIHLHTHKLWQCLHILFQRQPIHTSSNVCKQTWTHTDIQSHMDTHMLRGKDSFTGIWRRNV